MRITVIKSHWNDTDTIKLVGQVGKITSYSRDIEFVDVLFNHSELPVTLHYSEIEEINKNKTTISIDKP